MRAFAAEFLDGRARHWKLATLESQADLARRNILLTIGHLTVDAIAAATSGRSGAQPAL